MAGLIRECLFPSPVPRQPGIDPSELDWRNEVRDKTQKMICPPVQVQPTPDEGTQRYLSFWNLPEAQRESILAAEAEHREQAERERLAEARQAEAERLGIAAALAGEVRP